MSAGHLLDKFAVSVGNGVLCNSTCLNKIGDYEYFI